MATAYVTLCDVGLYNVPRGESPRSETVTTSGTAASGALVANVGQVAMIYCATAVYARSGATVTPATGYYIPAATPTPFFMGAGAVVSLIDA